MTQISSDGMKHTKRPRLATPTTSTSFHGQNVRSNSKKRGSQSEPIIIDSESDEDDTPQSSSVDPINVDSNSDEDEDNLSQPSTAKQIDVDSEDGHDEDDAPQPTSAASTTTSSLTAPTTTTASTIPSTNVTASSSSSRAPPGTWTTELRFLINEVIRDDGHFNANGLQCAQVIKALYPNFALAHLPDKELAKRVSAQWKERDYPNRADWVRVRAMRTGDEGMRAAIRGRVRGTGILR
ncbi:hypothetical protein HII31_01874 [Pseudocercospora fuligena]|uniref:Uncharacterized protein n=1 Tax=Pseudocercospora fuligena TaxID=685502 RepID=A0A8H6RVG3_9PEZI|nr:hypothetical protein HII31_01874 [Pseudocercospora fuligena]